MFLKICGARSESFEPRTPLPPPPTTTEPSVRAHCYRWQSLVLYDLQLSRPCT